MGAFGHRLYLPSPMSGNVSDIATRHRFHHREEAASDEFRCYVNELVTPGAR